MDGIREKKRIWSGGYTPFEDFEGTPNEAREIVKAAIEKQLENESGLLFMYPAVGRHVKAFGIEINIVLKRDPENDYLMSLKQVEDRQKKNVVPQE